MTPEGCDISGFLFIICHLLRNNQNTKNKK